MKKILKNWAAVMKELGIEEVHRVTRAARGMIIIQSDDVDAQVLLQIRNEFMAAVNSVNNCIDGSSAIIDGLKELAVRLDGPCQCGRGDEPDYCGCHERKEKMVERMLPLAKALPASLTEWNAKIKAYEEAGYLDDGIWSNKC